MNQYYNFRKHSMKQAQCHFPQYPGRAWVQISRRCQQIMSDDSLNNNRKFRMAVKSNPKGFVGLNLFLQDPIIKQMFVQLELKTKQIQLMAIRKSIWQFSSELKCNSNKIRRIMPYYQKMRQVKPVLIENIPLEWTKQQIIEAFNLNCQIYCILIKQDSGHFFMLVFCSDPYELIEKSQEIQIKYKMRVHGFQAYYNNIKSYHQGRIQEVNPKITHHGWDQLESPQNQEYLNILKFSQISRSVNPDKLESLNILIDGQDESQQCQRMIDQRYEKEYRKKRIQLLSKMNMKNGQDKQLEKNKMFHYKNSFQLFKDYK